MIWISPISYLQTWCKSRNFTPFVIEPIPNQLGQQAVLIRSLDTLNVDMYYSQTRGHNLIAIITLRSPSTTAFSRFTFHMSGDSVPSARNLAGVGITRITRALIPISSRFVDRFFTHQRQSTETLLLVDPLNPCAHWLRFTWGERPVLSKFISVVSDCAFHGHYRLCW